MIVRSRIMWVVDLKRTEDEIWTHKILNQIKREKYKKCSIQFLPCEEIKNTFFAFYQKLIIGRSDFRLDIDKTLSNIERMSHDKSYLLILISFENVKLGGIVLRKTENEYRVCYRAIDHTLAKKMDLTYLDYYLENYLQNKLRSEGVLKMTHGTDVHPLTQLGLSNFKLKIGAVPHEVGNAELVEFNTSSHVGYYSNPILGKYSEFHLHRDVPTDILNEFTKLSERAGIRLVVEY